MKQYELQDNPDNIRKTIMNNWLHRNEFLSALYQMFTKETDFLSVSLDGDWGSGKTFFVKQFQLLVEEINKKNNRDNELVERVFGNKTIESNRLRVVYFDAWENDDEFSPLLSLVYSIVDSGEKPPKGSRNNETIVDNGVEILDAVVSTLAGIPGINIGRALVEVGRAVKKENIYEEIKESKKIKYKIYDWLESLAPSKEKRLVIIIDELDRCRPDFAVKLLEVVKHYFVNPNITFLFAVNYKELTKTIRKFYGDDFNSERYLNRFFDFSLLISNDKTKIMDIAKDDEYLRADICKAVVKIYDLQLREQVKLLDELNTIRYLCKQKEFMFSEGKKNLLILLYVMPIAVALKLTNREVLKSFINGEDDSSFIRLLDIEHIKEAMIEDFLDIKEFKDKLDDQVIKDNKKLGNIMYTCLIDENVSKKIIDFSNLVSDYSTLNGPVKD